MKKLKTKNLKFKKQKTKHIKRERKSKKLIYLKNNVKYARQ